MSEVIPFPVKRHPKYTRPVCARTGDRFAKLEMQDESFAGFGVHKGAVFILILDEEICDNCTHAFTTKDGTMLGIVKRLSASRVHLISFSDSFPSGEFDADDLEFFAHVVEFYPTGLTGARWVLWNEEMIRVIDQSRPVIKVNASL